MQQESWEKKEASKKIAFKEAASKEAASKEAAPMVSGIVPTSSVDHAGRQAASPSKWLVLLVVAIGVFMSTLDSSIVNISLPTIARSFDVPLSGAIEWVIIAYLVATAAIMLTAGRLADMIGQKIVWMVGLALFTLSSATCGFAPSLAFLIGARAVQGLGGALLMAVSPAMLTKAFPANERGRAMGINAVIVSLGVSSGPIIGGLITGYFSWRWIFYVNVPIGIIGFVATTIVLRHQRLEHNEGHFDPLGALLLAVGLASLAAGLSFGSELGWGSAIILVLLIVGIVALGLLPVAEHFAATPVIVFSLLKSRVFASSLLSLILSFLALFAVSFMLPFYLEQLRGFSTQLSGVLLIPFPLVMAIIAPFSGILADRIGTRWLAASGLAVACVGLVALSFVNAQSSILSIVWRLMLTGAGQALFQSPNNSALLGAAPREHQGSASGFLATGRVMGQTISIAIAGAIFTGLGGAMAGAILASNKAGSNVAGLQQTFVSSFHVTLLACAAIAAVGIFASLIRGKEEVTAGH